jgi:hypothetical protein
MESLRMNDEFETWKYAEEDVRSMRKKSIPVTGLTLLLFAILSISGCTGIGGASKTTSSQQNSPGPGALNASPTSLSFSSVNIGSNRVLPVVFTNSGNSNVTISNVTISGAGYTAGGVQSGQILTPGQTATLNVTFAPAGTGPIAGSVSVTSNATNSPATISLSGNGVQAGSHSVALSWTASTSAVAGYNVYRSQTSGGPYSKLDSTIVAASSYSDSNVLAGQTYYYVVTSVTSAGVESADSMPVSATIP